ncbi:anti-sigma factor [Actinopolymorpha sp. B9G3]|uniref:anti-sigma factor n=1 Tax=Actinopolymorpha sp. B9G3 TaxID=3158970 RepID=UPI0032D9430D
MNPDDRLKDYLETGASAHGAPDGAVRVRALLGSPAVWEGPPDLTLRRVLSQIETERRGGGPRIAAERSAAEHPAGDRRAGRPGRGRRTRRAAQVGADIGPARRYRAAPRHLLVAAAAVLIFGGGAVGGWFAAEENVGRRGTEVVLAGTELAPDAGAVARVRDTASGLAITVRVTGLPPAPPGTFYEAWMKSPEGHLVPIGTFHLKGDEEPVELWAGIDPARYPLLTVTLQREGEGTESSGRVVLSGTIAPAR